MRHITTSLNASLPFFIKQNGWVAVIVFPSTRAGTHTTHTGTYPHTPTRTLALSAFLPHAHALTFTHTHTRSVSLLVQRVTCEKLSVACVTREEIPANVRALFCHAATSGRINGVQLFSNVIHFTGFGSQPDPPSVSCSLSLSLSPEFVLHFVMLRACHPYSMSEVQHEPHPRSDVEFCEFGSTLDIPLQCHRKKRVRKEQRDSCKENGALLSESQCLRFLFKALIWICLTWELFLLR